MGTEAGVPAEEARARPGTPAALQLPLSTGARGALHPRAWKPPPQGPPAALLSSGTGPRVETCTGLASLGCLHLEHSSVLYNPGVLKESGSFYWVEHSVCCMCSPHDSVQVLHSWLTRYRNLTSGSTGGPPTQGTPASTPQSAVQSSSVLPFLAGVTNSKVRGGASAS